jgi:hypothetical protein
MTLISMRVRKNKLHSVTRLFYEFFLFRVTKTGVHGLLACLTVHVLIGIIKKAL